MTTAITRAITVVALLLLVCGCTTPDTRAQHPLLNVIVSADSGAAVARPLLAPAMLDADVIYLGEKHDNPAHHQHQLWVLSELIRLGHRPLLGFEIFSVMQSGALMEYSSAAQNTDPPDRAESALRATMGVVSAQDEDWLRYAPLLQLARTHKLTVFGIDLPMALRRRISRVGIAGLSAVERGTLPDIGIADPEYRKLMLTRLKAAHCGHGAEAYLQRLFENWQARNETMARTITSAASARGDSPVLVILGGGHVRSGEGVIPRVAQHMPSARQLVVSFVEVDEAHLAAIDYLAGPQTASNEPGVHKELLWFTAAHGLSMDDACAMFRHAKKS